MMDHAEAASLPSLLVPFAPALALGFALGLGFAAFSLALTNALAKSIRSRAILVYLST